MWGSSAITPTLMARLTQVPGGSGVSRQRRPQCRGTPATRAAQGLGQQYGVPVWLTEVSEGPGTNDYGFDAIENVLARAIHIHDNFEYAGASAPLGMNTIWDSQTHEEHFAGRGIRFLSERSGMVLVDVSTGKISITGMGYAVGHYARWIRRGAIRIGATSEKSRVITTAFRDPANSRLVVVVVNNEATEQLLRVRLSDASARAKVNGGIVVRQCPLAGHPAIRGGLRRRLRDRRAREQRRDVGDTDRRGPDAAPARPYCIRSGRASAMSRSRASAISRVSAGRMGLVPCPIAAR